MMAQNVSMVQLSDLLSRVVIKWRYVDSSQLDKCVCMTNFWLEKMWPEAGWNWKYSGRHGIRFVLCGGTP